jgi:hypothetical protein
VNPVAQEEIMAKRNQGQSDDVFAQLGFKREEALNLRLRSEMMNALIAEIEKKGLTPRRKRRRNWASLNHGFPT